ncbi:MAG: VCBS repeat-containing protein [Nocardioides sp.]
MSACLLTAALACSLLPAAVPPTALAAGGEPTSNSAHRHHRPPTVGVPAVLTPDGISARIPGGGTVSYRLPALPADGVRVLGDWNGDGAQTAGTFAGGRWELWNQLQRPERAPAATVTFGRAGDVPVTGDWNGDGVTDIGVVRGTTWRLALGPFTGKRSPRTWKRVTLGNHTGIPVVGDWRGTGRDGIGVFHDGWWTLAYSLDRPRSTIRTSYGRTGDVPVVGDWDRTGRDGIGVVRGTTWYLSDSVRAPRKVSQRTFAGASDEAPTADEDDTGAAVPAVWRVARVPGGHACPTGRPGLADHAAWVVPSRTLGRSVTAAGVTDQVRTSLQESERYLLGTQYAANWEATSARPYLDLLDRGVGDELAIRLPAMSALAVAVGLETGAYDDATVGRSRAFGLRYVEQLVGSIACAHAAVSPGGWGRGWETAHWAWLTGSAAWLVWRHLSPQTRAEVAAMVVDEADHAAAQAVEYWARPDGHIVTPGDTKAEESSWSASLLDLADAMMPSAPHARRWRAKAAELAASAYATKADARSHRRVNGIPLDRRLHGFNAYPDGTVENHGIIHPDYDASIQLLWTAADFDRLARRRVPEAMFHNAGLVYSAFSTVQYRAGARSPAGGTYDDPGGTVYDRGHSLVYYPQGDDWGLARKAQFVSLDAHAAVYRRYLHLKARAWPAAQALAWHEKGQRDLVAASGATDGRTYSVDPTAAAVQDTYPGREEYAAQNLATAWLALYVRQLGIPHLDRNRLRIPTSTARAAGPPARGVLAP